MDGELHILIAEPSIDKELKLIQPQIDAMTLDLPAHSQGLDPARTTHCTGVWGGNQDVCHDIRAARLIVSIFSRASDGIVGGDIYYVAVCEDELLARVILCDVQGHGMPVNELTTWIYGALRESVNTIEGNRVLTALNAMLFEKGPLANATAALITYNTSDGLLHFSYAGHPPILLKRRTSQQWLPLLPVPNSNRSNLPIGMFAATSYDQESISLEPGDRLALYTDGLIEAESRAGEEFGLIRLAELLERSPSEDISWMKDQIIETLAMHSCGAESTDDQTLMLIEIA